jgi:hypothetical protein
MVSVADSDYQRLAGVITSSTANDFSTQTARVSGLSSDTEYVAVIYTTDYLAITSCTAWERKLRNPSTDGTAVIDTRTMAAKQRITDADMTAIRTNSDLVWRTGGATLCNLSMDGRLATWTTTSATFENVLQPSHSTTVGANTAGFNLNVRYHNAIHTSNVPCTVGVFAASTTASGGELAVVDSSGTLATVSGFTTTVSLQTADFNLSGDVNLNKLDFHFRITGSATQLTVFGVAIWEND